MGTPTPTPGPSPAPAPAPTPTPTPGPTPPPTPPSSGPTPPPTPDSDPAQSDQNDQDSLADWEMVRQWIEETLLTTDPFTGAEMQDGAFNPYTGQNVEAFTNVPASSANPYAINGDDRNLLAPGEPTRLIDSPYLLASNGPVASTGPELTLQQVNDLLRDATQVGEKIIGGATYYQFVVNIDGAPTYIFYNDRQAAWWTAPAAPIESPTFAATPSPTITPVVQPLAAPISPLLPATLPGLAPSTNNAARSADDDRDARIAEQMSHSVTIFDQAVRHVFTPLDASGKTLQGPLNLYSGSTARALAQAAPGYMIGQTSYAGPADAAEAALRLTLARPAPLPLPVGPYNDIWGTASAAAVRDAALSGSVATHNNPATLAPDSIQAVYELPTLRRYGGAMGGLGMLGGAALIYGGAREKNPIRATLGIAGGTVEVAAGASLLAGSLRTSAPLMQAGRSLGTVGAAVTAPLSAWSFHDNLSRGQWFDATVDASSFAASGLTVGGALAGSVALTEAGLVLGSFGIGVLVGTGIDKGLEAASKGVFGVDLSPSALIAFELGTLDRSLSYIWSDSSKPAYTQTVAWKLIEWFE